MSITDPLAPAVVDPVAACWYHDPDRRPSIGRCPQACNGAPTSAERQADGAERPYCEAHAHWRAQEGGRFRLYPIDRASAR
jgi:hypothetical protein